MGPYPPRSLNLSRQPGGSGCAVENCGTFGLRTGLTTQERGKPQPRDIRKIGGKSPRGFPR
jgi:hypothetical protein